MAKKEVAPAADVITGYCMKTKEKNVVMQNVLISKSARGGLFAKGTDAAGNKICAAVGAEKANAAIKAGNAKKEGRW